MKNLKLNSSKKKNKLDDSDALILFHEKSIKSQILFEFACFDWELILEKSNSLCKTNTIKKETLNKYKKEFSKDIKNLFIEKLKNLFNSPIQEGTNCLSQEENEILRLFLKQIKEKKIITEPDAQKNVQSEEIPTVSLDNSIHKKEKRITIVNTPQRKPAPTMMERQVRAMSEAKEVANIIGNNGLNRLDIMPTISSENEFYERDPNQF